MSRIAVLPIFLLALLAGCTSFSNSHVRSDFYETGFRGEQALQGNEAAFDRLAELQKKWAARGKQGFVYGVTPWDRGNRDNAAAIAAATARVVGARDAILSQRELTDVMANALKDLESEYDAITDMLSEGNAQPADIKLAADQKYLTRRLANSLVLMLQSDMSPAVEAADTFGRDVAQFQHLLDAAINGDEDLGVEPPSNPDVEDSFSQIEELFSGYVAESSGDVLENVVVRYDAWNALQEIAAIGDAVMLKVAVVAPAAADQPAVEAPAADEDAADESGADDGAADEGASDEAAGDAGATADDSVDDGATDEPGADDGDVEEDAADAEQQAF